jgi:putative copper resistance protein D
MDDPLIFVRVVHLLATMLIAGAVFFRAWVAEPVLGAAPYARFRERAFLAINLVALVVSGAAWLGLLAARIGEPSSFAEFRETAWTLLTQTQFGVTSQLRFGLALVLAATVLRPAGEALSRYLAVAASALLAGTLAWSGHGGATPGLAGDVHAAADVLHLVAAAAWLGGLVPLVLLMRELLDRADAASSAAMPEVLRRFSNLGVGAVATVLMTGTVNACFALGNVGALFDTDYGRVLLVKLALFGGMVALAAVNRLKLAAHPMTTREVGAIYRNALAEIALGVAIVVVVGMLGIMDPAALPHAHVH